MTGIIKTAYTVNRETDNRLTTAYTYVAEEVQALIPRSCTTEITTQNTLCSPAGYLGASGRGAEAEEVWRRRSKGAP